MAASEKILSLNVKPAVMQIKLLQSRIISVDADGVYSVEGDMTAIRAFSCLLKPEPGDLVLVSMNHVNEAYILQVLAREHENIMCKAEISHPRISRLLIRGKKLNFLAEQELDIHSLGDIKLSACFGNMLVSVKNLLKTVSNNLIENIEYRISKVEHSMLNVKHLSRIHARQQIITADQDIKIDAERINMG